MPPPMTVIAAPHHAVANASDNLRTAAIWRSIIAGPCRIEVYWIGPASAGYTRCIQQRGIFILRSCNWSTSPWFSPVVRPSSFQTPPLSHRSRRQEVDHLIGPAGSGNPLKKVNAASRARIVASVKN